MKPTGDQSRTAQTMGRIPTVLHGIRHSQSNCAQYSYLRCCGSLGQGGHFQLLPGGIFNDEATGLVVPMPNIPKFQTKDPFKTKKVIFVGGDSRYNHSRSSSYLGRGHPSTSRLGLSSPSPARSCMPTFGTFAMHRSWQRRRIVQGSFGTCG